MTLTPEQAERLAADLLGGAAVGVQGGDVAEAVAGVGGAPSAEPPVPERIGAYLVVRRIAVGGMGAVYEAEQERPRRTVAVKVLRRSLSMPKALERFAHEAEILAHLHHPAIAQVYDAGTFDDGGGAVSFFAMEHVPGARPITEHAEARGLAVRQRLDLFALVCDAVHHGHQKGVIHRDLKPANILVDEAGHAKVIDFGVARATDADVAITTMRTDVRELVGTLQYMSPEQCNGDPHEIDVRSDVYSLGVVLYELICGELPYRIDAAHISGAARQVRELAPRPPSAHGRRVRRDLRIILLKALEKSRERRYQSAHALAEDVRRHLIGAPIAARPPSPWTRLTGWMSGHPLLTTAGACAAIVVCALVPGLVAARLAWTRPYDIVMTADRREARLVSALGAVLHRWQTDTAGPLARSPQTIACARLVERNDGRRFVVIVGTHGPGPLAATVSAFDLALNLDEPVWQRAMETGEVPPSLAAIGRDGTGFGATLAQALDVFPDTPDPEIVVVFQHEIYSQCALRVYDLDGELLYQLWHDGNLSAMHWMPDKRLLVVAGLNAEAHWPDRGATEVASELYPTVLFAISPEVGQLSDDWEPLPELGVRSRFLWYRCLLPPALADEFGADDLHAPFLGDRHAQGHFRVVLSVRATPDASVNLLMNADGREVPRRRVTTDTWTVRDDLPDPSALEFGDLPPISVPRPTGTLRDTAVDKRD